jgi:MFS family permease
MGQVRDLVWVGALTLLLGLVDPPFIPAARAAVADVVPVERRPRAYGLLGVASSVGWIAGPSVGAGLSFLGYPALFAISGLILAVYIVILVLGLRETRPTVATDRGRGLGGGERVAAYEGMARDGRAAAADAAEAMTSDAAVRVFVAFLALAAIIHAASFQWVVTLPVHAHRDFGMSTATWGLLFAVNGILILFFQLRISTASEGRSKPRFIAVGALCYAAGYLAVALAPGPEAAIPVLALTIVLVSIGEMFVFPVEPAFASELSPVALRGRYQGLLGAAIGLGSAVGPPVGGAILDSLPGAPVWLVSSGLAVLAAGGFWWLGGAAAAITSATLSSPARD